jgi:hypothetical protein
MVPVIDAIAAAPSVATRKIRERFRGGVGLIGTALKTAF